MVNSHNLFSINMLPKTATILLSCNSLLTLNFIVKRKKTKIRFKNKKKIKKTIITPTFVNKNTYINYNKTIQKDFMFRYALLRKKKYILRCKLKWNFKKFKYHGKGYKVKKFDKLSKITFRFGKSHWTKLIFNKKVLWIKRIKKNKYCCFSIKNKTFIDFKNLVTNIKGVNKYTKRGIRLNRQLLKKRFGKISQASSVYK